MSTTDNKKNMENMSLPMVDGHFWIERDGKIIDPFFKEYTFIKNFNNLTGNRVYLEADVLTSTLIITKFKKGLDSIFDTDVYRKFRESSIECKRPKAIFGGCYQNSIIEMVDNGGKLKFGSMGWHKKSGGIHYEFGGENWKYHQFLRL
jgi:hypothetical protein